MGFLRWRKNDHITLGAMKDMLRTPTNSMDTGQPGPTPKRYWEGAKVSAAKVGGQKGRDPAILAKQRGWLEKTAVALHS